MTENEVIDYELKLEPAVIQAALENVKAICDSVPSGTWCKGCPFLMSTGGNPYDDFCAFEGSPGSWQTQIMEEL